MATKLVADVKLSINRHLVQGNTWGGGGGGEEPEHTVGQTSALQRCFPLVNMYQPSHLKRGMEL